MTPTVEDITVVLTAIDPPGELITYTFNISFLPNSAPIVVNPSDSLIVNDNATFEYEIDLNDVFVDEEGYSLTFQVSGQPTFLTSSLVDGVFSLSGKPSNIHAGSTDITFEASDG